MMNYDQYSNTHPRFQGRYPSPQRGASNIGEDTNEMRYGPDSEFYGQQSGRTPNEHFWEHERRNNDRGPPAPAANPEPSYIHSNRSDTEYSGEKSGAYPYDNEEEHRKEMETLQQLEKTKTRLERELWIRDVKVFCSMQLKNIDVYDETYRKLTKEFAVLGLGVDQPENSNQQKLETKLFYQKTLLSLHNSYIQTLVNRGDSQSAKKEQSFPGLIKELLDINNAEWRQAYSLWCTVLCNTKDRDAENWLLDIWPKHAEQGESLEARLWRFQIGDKLCDHFDETPARIDDRKYYRKKLLKDRRKARDQLHDNATMQECLHQDIALTSLSLAQIYLDQLYAGHPHQSMISKAMTTLEETWNQESYRGLTPPVLTVGQKLGCLLYSEYRQDRAGQAQSILEKVWMTRKKGLSDKDDWEKTLITGHYLFLTYAYLREYSQAKSVFEEVWRTTEFMQKRLSDKTILKFYCLLTKLLRQNALDGAKDGTATNLMENSNDPDRLKLSTEIGIVFCMDKKYPEAECVLQQAYDIYKSDLRASRQSYDVIDCGRYLAEAFAGQGKYSDALTISKQVLPERTGERSEARRADDLRFHHLYSNILMKQANYQISSSSRLQQITDLYTQATKFHPKIVQDVFKKPDMHKCARHLLLELVSLRDFAEAESLLDHILGYPELVSREILPLSFRSELCKSVVQVANHEKAIDISRKMECLIEDQELPRVPDTDSNLIFCLLEAGKPEAALKVFKNARRILRRAAGDATTKVPSPTLIVTPAEEETPTTITKAGLEANRMQRSNWLDPRPTSPGSVATKRGRSASSATPESLRSPSHSDAPRRRSSDSLGTRYIKVEPLGFGTKRLSWVKK